MTVATYNPIGLKRRVNLFIDTSEEVVSEYYHVANHRQATIAVEQPPRIRITRTGLFDYPLNKQEKFQFLVLNILVYSLQFAADFHFWQQTNSQLLSYWAIHRITLLFLCVLLFHQQTWGTSFLGHGNTMKAFEFLVEYEKISSVAYHSLQFGIVTYNGVVRKIFDMEAMYHTFIFIFILAYLYSTKYKKVV
jgi:hypothetical protein